MLRIRYVEGDLKLITRIVNGNLEIRFKDRYHTYLSNLPKQLISTNINSLEALDQVNDKHNTNLVLPNDLPIAEKCTMLFKKTDKVIQDCLYDDTPCTFRLYFTRQGYKYTIIDNDDNIISSGLVPVKEINQFEVKVICTLPLEQLNKVTNLTTLFSVDNEFMTYFHAYSNTCFYYQNERLKGKQLRDFYKTEFGLLAKDLAYIPKKNICRVTDTHKPQYLLIHYNDFKFKVLKATDNYILTKEERNLIVSSQVVSKYGGTSISRRLILNTLETVKLSLVDDSYIVYDGGRVMYLIDNRGYFLGLVNTRQDVINNTAIFKTNLQRLKGGGN